MADESQGADEPTPDSITKKPGATDSTRPSLRSRVAHPEFVTGVVVLVGGVIIAALGLAAVPRGWILAGTVLLTFGGILVGYAARADVVPETRARLLGWAVGCLVLVIVGVAAYNVRFDPTRNEGRRLWEFVLADASDVQCINVRGEPAGQPLLIDKLARPLAPVCGGSTYFVECREELDDGTSWLRLAGGNYWVAEDMMRPRRGTSASGLSSCD